MPAHRAGAHHELTDAAECALCGEPLGDQETFDSWDEVFHLGCYERERFARKPALPPAPESSTGLGETEVRGLVVVAHL